MISSACERGFRLRQQHRRTTSSSVRRRTSRSLSKRRTSLGRELRSERSAVSARASESKRRLSTTERQLGSTISEQIPSRSCTGHRYIYCEQVLLTKADPLR